MNQWQIIRWADYHAMPWKNGQGVTQEIMRVDSPNGRDFRWRLSMAEVSSDGDFSSYTGYQRILSILEGDGLQLKIDGRIEPPILTCGIQRFSGDSRVSSTLLNGKVRDLNLIYDPRYYGARLQWVTTSPNMPPLRCHASTIILFCHDGEISLTPVGGGKSITLNSYDSAVLVTPRPQTHTVDLDGHGHLGVFELTGFDE
ncbi:HutD family protein [Hafnia alvei]|uniref:HutD/Ves family protein n=1 Tax=Hafnia alvei TaxID=569 RepID=UPI001F47DEE3|nr:HutD family protein [Hafnia alvei]MCE9870612.1 HutD family protein [Hafnia alvei]